MVCDPLADNRGHMHSLFPQSASADDIEKTLAVPCDLAVIATPPRFHAEQAIAFLSKGIAVLSEKPMAVSSREADAMVAAARVHGALLAVGLYKRFFPACEAIKGLIAQRPFGRLIRYVVEEGEKFAWQPASGSFFQKSSTPGGVLLDLGVHTLDLVLWWIGDPTSFVYEDDAMGGQEANCRLVLDHQNGCHGEIRLSRDWHTENLYTFFFERAVVRYRVNAANHLEIMPDGMSSILCGDLRNVSHQGGRAVDGGPARTNPQSFIEQLRNVIAATRGEEKLRVPGEEGIRSLRFIENCYSQRRLMPMPWLPAKEETAACNLASGGSNSEVQPT